MKNSPKVYLIGNAHLDPVWLWRFPEGESNPRYCRERAVS